MTEIRRVLHPERHGDCFKGYGSMTVTTKHTACSNWKTATMVAILLLAGFPLQSQAQVITLGTAGNFAVLAGSTVTNTGPSVIDGGHVGVSPGTAITGFPPGIIVPPFTMHAGNAVALQAQTDLATAYSAAAALPPTQDLSGQDLGGLTLQPGVYFFSSSAQLTGTLTLNNLGDPDAQFVFQIGSTLTTASDSSVVTINGGSIAGCTVFWQVGSSATLGTDTAFEGHILALASITMNTNATILEGSALAQNGAVTLDTNTITNCISAVPEPGTMAVVFLGGAVLGLPILAKRTRQRHSLEALQLEQGVAV
jgi:type VI secretion system secreted protein VgrG